jgi:hypothetical protein
VRSGTPKILDLKFIIAIISCFLLRIYLHCHIFFTYFRRQNLTKIIKNSNIVTLAEATSKYSSNLTHTLSAIYINKSESQSTQFESHCLFFRVYTHTQCRDSIFLLDLLLAEQPEVRPPFFIIQIAFILFSSLFQFQFHRFLR